MKLALTLVLALAPLVAQAAPAGQSAVVHVTSRACPGAAVTGPAMAGSGVLIASDAHDYYVLTDSHVIYHGGSADGICVDVVADHGLSLPPSCVDFHAANFLDDLALLKIDAHCAEQVAARALPVSRFRTDYAALKAEATASGDFPLVTISGYPQGVATLRTYKGDIQAFDSQRHLIPAVDELIEVAPMQAFSVTSEFGMSGGLISGTQYLAGLSTQHFFRILPGQPATVAEADASAAPAATDGVQAVVVTLGLPGDVVADWVQGATTDRASHAFQIPLSLQLAGKTAVDFGGLRLTEDHCSHQQSWWIGGHGASIGGAATVTAGGVDDCTVTVEFPTAPSAQVWPWADSRPRWDDLVTRHATGHIRTVRSQTGEDRPIGSLAGLLKAVRLGYTPIVVDSWQIDDRTWGMLRTTELQGLETFKAARDWIRLLPGGTDYLAGESRQYEDAARAFAAAEPAARQDQWRSWALFNADGKTFRPDSLEKMHLTAAAAIAQLTASGDVRQLCSVRETTFGLYLWWSQSDDLMDAKLVEARAQNPNVVTGFPQVQLGDADFWSYVLMGVGDQYTSDWWDCLGSSERRRLWPSLAPEEQHAIKRAVYALSTHRDSVSDVYQLMNPAPAP